MNEATSHPITVEPMDEHNEKLVRNVHPPRWISPTPKPKYHLVAIGAGSGGLISSAIAASLGAKAALIEQHLLGGDCLNVGCVPSKGVIRAARAWKQARAASRDFGGPRVTADGEFATAMARMRRLRAEISRADSAERFRGIGVDVFLGHARFTGPDRVEVDGKTLRFHRAVIATGARAAAPPIPGIESIGYLTNESIFTLTELPRRLVVIGAGPIGCEMAQSFARFGSEVTLLDRSKRILPRDSEAASSIVAKRMSDDGVRYLSEIEIIRAERRGTDRVIVYRRNGVEGEVAGDQVLVAIGRAPNVDVGLEAAGVAYDPRDGVQVDDELRTTNPRVFAVGDICSKLKFTHLADAHARMVVENALFFRHRKVSRLIIPWVTYTSPEVAHVGYDEDDARAAGYDVDSIKVQLSEVDRAVLDGEDDGFLEIHVDRRNGRVLGGTLVAEHAGEMIGELAVVVTNRLKIGALGKTIHPYPTQGEVFRKAADAWNRRRLSPGLKKLFGWYFRLFG
jgi:pyruvate/2-oxoglutarate dehydrogenase complex dihydrolipoamide dehydrogenase (E3) component